jgi:hypothetical protein
MHMYVQTCTCMYKHAYIYIYIYIYMYTKWIANCRICVMSVYQYSVRATTNSLHTCTAHMLMQACMHALSNAHALILFHIHTHPHTYTSSTWILKDGFPPKGANAIYLYLYLNLAAASDATLCWRRYVVLATLRCAGDATLCWRRYVVLATLRCAGDATLKHK